MTKTRVFAIGAVALLVAAALPLAAQTDRLTANIPFEFTVGGKTMPAGQYEVWKSPASPAIVLRALNERAAVVSLVITGTVPSRDAAADAQMVFNRYGNQYFLHAVVDRQAAVAFTLPETRAEREMASTAPLHQEQVLAVLARR